MFNYINNWIKVRRCSTYAKSTGVWECHIYIYIWTYVNTLEWIDTVNLYTRIKFGCIFIIINSHFFVLYTTFDFSLWFSADELSTRLVPTEHDHTTDISLSPAGGTRTLVLVYLSHSSSLTLRILQIYLLYRESLYSRTTLLKLLKLISIDGAWISFGDWYFEICLLCFGIKFGLMYDGVIYVLFLFVKIRKVLKQLCTRTKTRVTIRIVARVAIELVICM